jgi:hypothetical protein
MTQEEINSLDDRIYNRLFAIKNYLMNVRDGFNYNRILLTTPISRHIANEPRPTTLGDNMIGAMECISKLIKEYEEIKNTGSLTTSSAVLHDEK